MSRRNKRTNRNSNTNTNTSLDEFEQKRTIIHRAIERYAEFFDNIDRFDLDEIQIRLTRFEPLIDEFDEVQTKIEITTLEDDAANVENDAVRKEFEATYYKLVAQTTNRIKALGGGQNSGVHPHTIIQQVAAASDILPLKLSALQLPTFDGNYNNWLYYRDTFESSVNNNTRLDNIQKFHYLNSTLKGDAAEVISSLELSAANYVTAWKIVRDRYDNKNLMIAYHVNALFNLQQVLSESHTALRHLLDTFTKHTRALELLGQPVSSWDTLIIHMVAVKLDAKTRREWEISIQNNVDLPKIDELTTFLTNRCRLLETLQYDQPKVPKVSTKHDSKPKVKAYIGTEARKCVFCKSDHLIYSCEEFLKLAASSRLKEIKRLDLCINCLRGGHLVQHCKSSACKKCGKKHNTLLHFGEDDSLNEIPKVNSNTPQPAALETHVNSASHGTLFELLPTAIVRVMDRDGNGHDCRALLDSGSQSSLISQEFTKRLKLPISKTDISLVGINNVASNIKSKTFIRISSTYTDFSCSVSCLVVPSVAQANSNLILDRSRCKVPSNITLADPSFLESKPIDLLLGAGVFFKVLLPGHRQLSKHGPVFHESQFGWIAAGSALSPQRPIKSETTFSNFSQNFDVNFELQKFWEVDKVPETTILSKEEIACEAHFRATTLRNNDGRFIVSLPKNEPFHLGDSLITALRCLTSLESRFLSKTEIKEQYTAFMREYAQLGHMTKIDKPFENNRQYFYLPHHFVVKPDSLTTKLRVVFNASSKTSNSKSLNDFFLNGPVIQSDLFSILLRFRLHAFVLSGDVEKMYRQILVHPNERDLQRIVWREDSAKPVEHYRLNTITYGTKSASFVAVRTLQELAKQNEISYPEASKIIIEDFYMDDLITSHPSSVELGKIRSDLQTILASGGFNLRKWVSNNPAILKDVSAIDDAQQVLLGDCETTKTLGVMWLVKSDTIAYKIQKLSEDTILTKRSVLSKTAQIFDPLGLLGPCVIIPKIIMQDIWRLGLQWDEPLPSDIYEQYSKFIQDFERLSHLTIPRVLLIENPKSIELHCFCDASEKAYGACVYIRNISEDDLTFVRLVCAKSRVAPTRALSIPRLELCAAHLAAKLVSSVISAIKIHIDKVLMWTDSSIVLSWIKSSSVNLKSFVAHRVSDIQELTSDFQWAHVKSTDNPADVLSRGLMPRYCEIWWNAPRWLALPHDSWPKVKAEKITDLSQFRNQTVISQTVFVNPDFYNETLEKYSNLRKLQRVWAYCLRFIRKIRSKIRKENFQDSRLLSIDELNAATNSLIGFAQSRYFATELKSLSNGQSVHVKSKLISLNPFYDIKDKVIRVGGRLKLSELPYAQKHPIVLPAHHHLTGLIARNEHRRLLHAGPQALLASLRLRYWPLQGRNLVRKVVRECVTCFRFNPTPIEYIMADLPKDRLTPSFAFSICGVDYGGPFLVRPSKVRNVPKTKCYVCLFVCFNTRAIHLELVGDLTSESFIAALSRFFHRRGKAERIYSDNGTAFVGAEREIGEFLANSAERICEAASSEGVSWVFIPPRSPHWGGLWEAGIKSVKYHLHRILGNASLTYEEFYTLLVEIEGCLNSRPLHPFSNDPSDFTALTPGHFLIGRPLTHLPEPTYIDVKENRLTRFQRVYQLRQHFWIRWSKEYVSELQQRVKWKQNHLQLLREGALVLIKEDQTPPLKWPIGRILELHTGSDGVTRAVTIKTVLGNYKRPVTKICVLPIPDNDVNLQ